MKSLNDFYKVATLSNALNLKLENPKMTKKDVAKNLHISERTLQRYSSDINKEVFQKKKVKNSYNPQNCTYCQFISKSKSGLSAHIRTKHKNEYIQNRQNQVKYTQNQDKFKNNSDNIRQNYSQNQTNYRQNNANVISNLSQNVQNSSSNSDFQSQGKTLNTQYQPRNIRAGGFNLNSIHENGDDSDEKLKERIQKSMDVIKP